MKGVLERDEVVFGARRIEDLARFARELYGGFVGFGAGIADENAFGVVHRAGLDGFLDEEFGESARPGVMVEV